LDQLGGHKYILVYYIFQRRINRGVPVEAGRNECGKRAFVASKRRACKEKNRGDQSEQDRKERQKEYYMEVLLYRREIEVKAILTGHWIVLKAEKLSSIRSRG